MATSEIDEDDHDKDEHIRHVSRTLVKKKASEKDNQINKIEEFC